MRDFRGAGIRDVIIVVITLVAGLMAAFIISGVFGIRNIYLNVVGAISFGWIVFFSDRVHLIRQYRLEQEHLESDLELKDILYRLLQKTSAHEASEDLYGDILKSAINAIPNGSKGSIIDVRNPKRVSYVAVEGFDRKVLEQMELGIQDTYLYKETHGSMSRTVVIKNSVNYNQLHSNDAYVQDLIEAGTVGVRSTICTPIRTQGKVIGMLNIDSAKRDAFNKRDIEIIEIFAMEVGKMLTYYETMQENLYLSQYDSMTQIYNRGHFYELHKALYKDYKDRSYIFVSTDIDNLKEVNDVHGHVVGDRLICHFVDVLKEHLDEEAIFGRYGGDEFNILMPDKSKLYAARLMEGVVRDLKDRPIYDGETPIQVSYSYGIVEYPDDETDYKQLIIKADKRMYAYKNEAKSKNN